MRDVITAVVFLAIATFLVTLFVFVVSVIGAYVSVPMLVTIWVASQLGFFKKTVIVRENQL